MVLAVGVVEIGDSLGIILPGEVLEKLGIVMGDTFYLAATPGGIRVTRNTPELAEKLGNAEQFMRKIATRQRGWRKNPSRPLSYNKA